MKSNDEVKEDKEACVREALAYWVIEQVERWRKGEINGSSLSASICPVIEGECDMAFAYFAKEKS